MRTPVAIVTDLDNRPNAEGQFIDTQKQKTRKENLDKLKNEFKDSDIILQIAKEWTLEWCLYKSTLSEFFKQSVQAVHSGTDEFKYEKDGNDKFKSSFEEKFIKKLRREEGTSNLDKVSIASVFAEKLEADATITLDKSDEYLDYLMRAIKHVCGDGDKK